MSRSQPKEQGMEKKKIQVKNWGQAISREIILKANVKIKSKVRAEKFEKEKLP